MKTYDHGYDEGKERLNRKGKNSNLKKLQRYVASLGNNEIMRMIGETGKPKEKKSDPTARSIFENSSGKIQTKMEVSQPGDKDELQADKVAEGVMKGDTDHSKKALSEKTGNEISPKAEGDVPQTSDAFDAKLQNTKGQGQKLDEKTQGELEQHTGTDLGGVNIHTHSEASKMSEDIKAKAFTHGQDIYFKEGLYNPNSKDGKELLAHEVAHTVQQGGGKVQAKIQRQSNVKSFPFVGYIIPYSAALRNKPFIDKANKYKYIDYDLPKGHEVTILSLSNRFYYISTKAPDNHKTGIKSGDKIEGYVSHELISKQEQRLMEFDPNLISKDQYSIDEAILLFTSAKRLKDDSHIFTTFEMNQLKKAKKTLEDTKKYTVDMDKLEVLFDVKVNKKPAINTIEDFILFVEDIERTYPKASPAEIVSEIRQIWYSGENWGILVASQGILNQGKTGKDKYVNIEDKKNNPIAKKYDLDKELGKGEGGHGKQIEINSVKVDIGHLIAGLDAAISGSPLTFPKQFLIDANYFTSKSEDKYKTMQTQSGGKVTDFTTWSGDIGQAYGEFLAEKYINDSTKSFKDYYPTKAADHELFGDIHGFIAKHIWDNMDKSKLASGTNNKISDILKTLYLQDKTNSKLNISYKDYFKKITGATSDDDLKNYIRDRSLKFAKPWFMKKAHDFRSLGGVFGPWSIESGLKEFDKKHKENEDSKVKNDQIDVLVEYFFNLLKGSLKK